MTLEGYPANATSIHGVPSPKIVLLHRSRQHDSVAEGRTSKTELQQLRPAELQNLPTQID